MKSVILLGAVLSIGLTSCQFTNKYKTPEIDSADLFRDQVSTDTTTIADIHWSEYFKDPFLKDLIYEALENNHDMLATAQTIKKAEAGLSMARAAYFPDVALVANADHKQFSFSQNGNKHVLGGMHDTQFSLGIAVSWEADLWGRMNRESRAAYAQMLSSHAYRNLVQTSLISNVASTYYALLAMDEQLTITKEMVGLQEETTQTMMDLKEAGMLTGASVEQSRGFLYGTKTTIPTLETQIKELENTLSLLLGRKPGAVQRGNIRQQVVIESLDFGIPTQMLAKRPDVYQAELAFRSAFELKTAAQASFYPSIQLTSGVLGFGKESLSNFFKPINLFANIAGGLTQPIFARKQLITNLKVRKAEEEEAFIRFEESVLNAAKEVSDIIYGYESSLKKNADRNEQVKSLDNSVSYTQALLKAGMANYTEVLDAEQGLLQAQLSQVSDKLEQLQYSVNMYRALGGGTDENN